jgi:hypothetical protein
MSSVQYSGVAFGVWFTDGAREEFLHNFANILNCRETNSIDDVDEFIGYPSDYNSTVAKVFPTIKFIDWFDSDNNKVVTIAYVNESFYKTNEDEAFLPLPLTNVTNDNELKKVLDISGVRNNTPSWLFFSYMK